LNYQKRLTRLREKLETKNLNCILVTENKNRQYLCGFDGSAGWLLVTPNRHFILTDGRYWDQVEQQCPEGELFKYKASEHKNLWTALTTLLKEEQLLPDKRILAVETDSMTLADFRSIKEALEEERISLEEIERMTSNLRECKDEEELGLMQQAALIADRALAAALRNFRPGLRELDLKAELEYQILKCGGATSSFPIIVASGPNGSKPHAGASQRIVGEGELITIDFGAVYQGYCSDMTRTIWYGELPEDSERILRHTRKAQEAGVAAVKAGIKASEVDAAARDYLASHDLEQYFVHSLGHGIGLDVHEAPGIRKSNNSELKVGQVITVEPGVYIPEDTGCRVEDTVVVTQSGSRTLNCFPKQALGSTTPPKELPEEPGS